MRNGKRVLAVIPARGGSKGIPLKNLKTIGGVSLVALAVKAGLAADSVDRIVASTDHEGIAAEAERAGAAAPFRRPENLSGPTIADWDVLNHALREMERIDSAVYDIILMLQPTSPSRTAAHVEAAITMLLEGGYDAVWSVSETDSKAHPLKQLTVAEGGALDYYDQAGAKIIARQQLKPVYHRNGIVYAFTRECILEQKTIKGRKTGALVITGHVSNIDTELDLAWAEFLLSREKAT